MGRKKEDKTPGAWTRTRSLKALTSFGTPIGPIVPNASVTIGPDAEP